MPNALKVYYPFKPYYITQHWGNPNPAYAQQFNDPTFLRHNGVDAFPVLQMPFPKTYPVYCPVENFTVMKVDFAPKGGGNELWLISNEELQIGDRVCHALIPLCHAAQVLVHAGDTPKLGELLMIGDNTGFSTGIHTHMGLYRVHYDGIRITNYYDVNDAAGSYNPEEFFTGTYAVDQASISTLILSTMRYYKYILGM